MSNSVSRRELIAGTIPLVAAGGALLAGAQALAQDAQPNTPVMKSAVIDMLMSGYLNNAYALPKLPYEYKDLEPHIDAQTMELHHSKHHNAYVTNLNKALESLAKLREEPEIDSARLSALSRDISFNAGGHTLHTIFFGILGKPEEITIPELQVKMDIVAQYGSLEKFQNHFNKVAVGVKGSGWAIACYEPMSSKILITESGDQDQRMVPTSIPFLLIDVWEHAYYLKHQNKRADYIKAWWNVVKWTEVNALYTRILRTYGK